MTTAVKRACDACHRRKVKCDGINPCRNCASAQLTCTYNAIPQKKGPKGSRAKVISELRETQRQTSLSAKVQNRINGIVNPPCSLGLSPTPGLMTGEMAKESVEFFFANMYPIMPILSRQRLEHEAMFMDQNVDTYCLLTSLSSFMMFQPGMTMPGLDPVLEHIPGANIVSATLLMEETIRVRKGVEYLEYPSLNGLCTSYFLFCCHYALELHDKAWFYLREATTLAHIMGMTKEETYSQREDFQGPRYRRLYWLLFITERAYALQRGRPLTLEPTVNLPTIAEDPADPLSHQLNGFILLANLFRPFDNTFLDLWNRRREDYSPSYLNALQKQLPEMLPPYMQGQDHEQSELRTSQQWLKAVIWQLSVHNGCVPQKCEDQMPYQYHVDMSRDIMSLTSQLSTQSTEILGVPMVAKLLELACNLTDVLLSQPSSGSIFTIGPREQLPCVLQILSALRSGEHHLLPLLLTKVHDILPRLVNPNLQRAPENACSVDIFDGFGNAGMGQPPLITEFKSEPFTPGPLPRMEDMVTDSASSTAAASSTDMGTPFAMVSSPTVMSPAVDYPHMGDFNNISDVIGSLGQGSQSALGNQGTLNHQQSQHQHQNAASRGMEQTAGMSTQLQHGMHSNIGRGLNQPQSVVGVTQSQSMAQNQGYNQMNQNIMDGLLQRQNPQRTNSYNVHQPPQIPRTVGDFHALQRANSDHVSMNPLGLAPMGGNIDFNGMR
ncbi:hypothetical protein DL764_009598 [Monosporascus ibericus]|uniref:Zn(2)-C6 fungal-type domain-containing protein n=1 Tax=Monosporascus ibericus TaxID=155417 RepID=A0A4Q4SWV9_9PEZI|nr:hypothetical protein DL764_009598 [Monosporascus ibericus]